MGTSLSHTRGEAGVSDRNTFEETRSAPLFLFNIAIVATEVFFLALAYGCSHSPTYFHFCAIQLFLHHMTILAHEGNSQRVPRHIGKIRQSLLLSVYIVFFICVPVCKGLIESFGTLRVLHVISASNEPMNPIWCRMIFARYISCMTHSTSSSLLHSICRSRGVYGKEGRWSVYVWYFRCSQQHGVSKAHVIIPRFCR